ncbi:MAG: right-handed parallel beta-helix repeat-containing protein [bacterium]|nr:right-handed parallel beta-helix repeat-containing protein [bacterium]
MKKFSFKHFAFLLLLSLVFACSESSTAPQLSVLGLSDSSNCVRTSPASGGTLVTVSNAAELRNAVEQANQQGNMTIQLEDGSYTLDDMLWISGSRITFRSRSGNRNAVVLRGQGMRGGVSHIFNVAGSEFTAADLTLGWVANHGIQIHSDADNILVHNVRFVDTGEQMLKVSYRPGDSTSSENGLVQWCLFEYPSGIGPQYYIGGIDAHQAHNWVVRHNVFRHIRSPESELAEHAIHFWSGSQNTLVEKNTIVNCDRGIGFGLGSRGHSGGIIRNNMVHTSRDVGIGLESARSAEVSHNTIFTENYHNSIEYRFSATQNVMLVNNLTNAAIASRDGGSATLRNNVISAQSNWFVDARQGDLHLSSAVPQVVDRGASSGLSQDIDCDKRPSGTGCDIGADEL